MGMVNDNPCLERRRAKGPEQDLGSMWGDIDRLH